MVTITVKFMSIPRLRAGRAQVEFASSENKLGNVLKEIVHAYHIADIILTEKGEVRPYARVLVNGRSFQFIGGLDAKLSEGDTVALIYPWLGHEDF